MSDGRINVIATLDDKDYNKKLENMSKGVKGLEKSFDDSSKPIETLNRKMLETASIIKENENSLKKLNEQISKAPRNSTTKNTLITERDSLKKIIDEDKGALFGYRQEVANLRLNHTTLNRELLNVRKQMESLALAGKSNTKEYQELKAKAQQYTETLKQVSQDTKKVVQETNQIPEATKKSGRGFKDMFTTVASYFGVFTAITTVIGLIKGAFNTIVQFDSQLLNVSKTTGLAGQELKNLGVSLRYLSEELKVVSISKLTEYATVAGQLGVKGTQDILAFTKALAMLEITSNISGEEGGSQIARFLTLTDGGVKNVADFGDEVTKLGNNFAATEAEIVKNSLAIAQNTGVYKLGRQEALAYGTATKAIGVEAELTGATVGRTLAVIDNILRTGKNAQSFSKITGESVEDLKAKFKTDPSDVLYSFVKGLNTINKSGGSVVQTLNNIGINGDRDEKVLGSLASNGFNVLTRALEDVGNASGSMQSEFDTASGKISNSIEAVKVSWENFILSVNGSQNTIGEAISFWAIKIAELIKYIGRLSTSWQELQRLAGEKGYKRGFDFVLGSETNADDAIKELYKVENARRSILNRQKQLEKELENSYSGFGITSVKYWKGGRSKSDVQEDIEKTKDLIGEMNGQMAGYRKIISGVVGVTEEVTNKTDETVTKTKEQLNAEKKLFNQKISFIEKVAKLEKDINQSILSGRELELSKITEKYADLTKEAEKLNVSQSKLNELRLREIEILDYKRDTENIKSYLDSAKSDYAEFEEYKKKIGIENANEMYKEILDVSKSYQDLLTDELNNLSGRDLTDLEKDRFNVLSNLLIEYNKNKSEEERKQLQELFVNTMSIEQKITVMKEKYAKLNADLESKFKDEELEKRKKELEKQFKNEIDGLSQNIVNSVDDYANVADLVAGSTRKQIESQIQSLTNFINSTASITEVQRNTIQGMINNLQLALPSANGESQQGATSSVINEFNQITNEVYNLNKAIEDLKTQGGSNVDAFASDIAKLQARIDGLNSRKIDLKFEFIKAGGKDLENLGNQFIELSQSIGGTNNVLGGFLSLIGGIARTSGSVLSSLGSIGGAFKNIKDQGGLGSIFSAGSEKGGFLGGLGSLANSISPIVAGATALFNIVDGISKKQKEEYNRFKEWQRNVYLGELEYQALLRKRRFDLAGRTGTTADNLKAQIAEVEKQLPDLKKQYEDQLNELLSEGRYIVDRWREKTLVWSKTKTKWGDLLGLDYDDLEKLFEEGKIEGGTKEMFEALKKTKEELEELGYTWEELVTQLNEYTTGTSASDLSNTFADMFANGTNSAIEFGYALEDVIKNAIISGFKAKYIDQAMDELFNKLADFSTDEDGLTQSEIDEFNRLAQEALGGLNTQWQQLISGLDIDFGNTEDFGSNAKDGIKRITETQADRLTGILTGVQVDVIESRKALQLHTNLLSSSYNELVEIQVNTRRTADSNDSIDGKMTTLINAVQSTQNFNQSIGM